MKLPKRDWKAWPGRIPGELNGVSGVAGIGGAAMGVAGATVLAGTAAATALMFGGLAVVVGVSGYALLKAVPPKYLRPQDLVGRSISLADLERFCPSLKKIAFIGPRLAGKTTLKNRLIFEPKTEYRDRTDTIAAHIVPLPFNPPVYVAVIDGQGDRYTQQFKIALPADIVCIVIDHNKSDSDTSISDERLNETETFLTQIRGHLSENNAPKKERIDFLINKRDLWESDTQVRRDKLIQSYQEEVRKWKEGNFSLVVSSSLHSNENGDDIARFVKGLGALLKQ